MSKQNFNLNLIGMMLNLGENGGIAGMIKKFGAKAANDLLRKALTTRFEHFKQTIVAEMIHAKRTPAEVGIVASARDAQRRLWKAMAPYHSGDIANLMRDSQSSIPKTVAAATPGIPTPEVLVEAVIRATVDLTF